MKVICIGASPNPTTGMVPKFKEGQICNVTQCSIWANSYKVDEHLFDGEFGLSWFKSRFIPLSEIDETETIRETALTLNP